MTAPVDPAERTFPSGWEPAAARRPSVRAYPRHASAGLASTSLAARHAPVMLGGAEVGRARRSARRAAAQEQVPVSVVHLRREE